MKNLTDDEARDIVKKIEKKQEELMKIAHELTQIFNELPNKVPKAELKRLGIDFDFHPSIIISMTLRDPDDEQRTKYFLATIGVPESIIGNFVKLYNNDEMAMLSRVARKHIKRGNVSIKVGKKKKEKSSGIVDFNVSVKNPKKEITEKELATDFSTLKNMVNELPDSDPNKEWLLEQIEKLYNVYESVKGKDLSLMEKLLATSEAVAIIGEIEKRDLHGMFDRNRYGNHD